MIRVGDPALALTSTIVRVSGLSTGADSAPIPHVHDHGLVQGLSPKRARSRAPRSRDPDVVDAHACRRHLAVGHHIGGVSRALVLPAPPAHIIDASIASALAISGAATLLLVSREGPAMRCGHSAQGAGPNASWPGSLRSAGRPRSTKELIACPAITS